MKPVICWFRRDLRLNDQSAFDAALLSNQPIIPLFILDPVILHGQRFSRRRYQFMCEGLRSLDSDLRRVGGSLVVLEGTPLAVLNQIIDQTGATTLFFNRDYTPYARIRDDELKSKLGINVQGFDDRLLVLPGEVIKNDGSPYTVYTPFMKKWKIAPKRLSPNLGEDSGICFYNLSRLSTIDIPALSVTTLLPEATAKAAQVRLYWFMSQPIYEYAKQRDTLGNPHENPLAATSVLSPYIRFGLLSLREIYWAAQDAYDLAETEIQRESVTQFINEIIWHEFYTHILWHFPQVKTQNFKRGYDAIAWREDLEGLQRWKGGFTGYPIVDAAMRQLNSIGWMPNRARMIVASFLTKDLLIHWHEGELHFIQHLIDGDLAANNGGWQWAAGTGADAQPYFRIFNPVAQSRKFDPAGHYIRYWIPELHDIPTEHIHTPWEMAIPPADYPAPIVDHKQARKRTLTAFKQARNTL